MQEGFSFSPQPQRDRRQVSDGVGDSEEVVDATDPNDPDSPPSGAGLPAWLLSEARTSMPLPAARRGIAPIRWPLSLLAGLSRPQPLLTTFLLGQHCPDFGQHGVRIRRVRIQLEVAGQLMIGIQLPRFVQGPDFLSVV